MTTDIERAEALASKIDDLGPAMAYRAIVKAFAEKRTEDELLASVMRKLLTSDGYSNWGHYSNGGYWVTIDVRQETITAEEMQAIDDAAPAS